jgi:hypothetical protein
LLSLQIGYSQWLVITKPLTENPVLSPIWLYV